MITEICDFTFVKITYLGVDQKIIKTVGPAP